MRADAAFGTAKLAALDAAARLYAWLAWARGRAASWFWWVYLTWWSGPPPAGYRIDVQRGRLTASLVGVDPADAWPALLHLWKHTDPADCHAGAVLAAAGPSFRAWLSLAAAGPGRARVALTLEPGKGWVSYRCEPAAGEPGPESCMAPLDWSLPGLVDLVLRGDTPASSHVLARLGQHGQQAAARGARLRRYLAAPT